MKNYKIAFLLAACLVCGSLVTAACSGGGASADSGSKTSDAKTAAPAGDSIGVAECDQYLAAYETCLKDKAPAQAREMLKASFDQTRASWKQAASTPEGRAGLAAACKAARDTARQTMGSYGCTF